MKWKLREKVLLLTALAALLPFLTSNIYWYFTSLGAIRRNAENTIVLTTSQAAHQVTDFINAKLLGVLAHSQGVALLNGESSVIQEDLLHLLVQDPDIDTLVFVDSSGDEQVKVSKTHVFAEHELHNVADSDAFKIASFKFGKEYIGPVVYGAHPSITIAVPIAYPDNAQSLRTFSSANNSARYASEVRGVLISTVSLDQLTQNLNALRVGASGDVYLVDADRRLISYADSNFVGMQIPDNRSEVSRFSHELADAKNVTVYPPIDSWSVRNYPVLSSHERIERTNWAVITEIPLAELSKDTTEIQKQVMILSLLPLSALLVISLYFARKLINPIRSMALGAQAIAQGNFNYVIPPLKTGDELEQLANAYSNMSEKIEMEQSSLLSQKNTLSTILGSIADGVIALDKDFKVVFSNRAADAILGLHKTELEGESLDSHFIFSESDERITIATLCKDLTDSKLIHKLTYSVNANTNRTINLTLSAVQSSLYSDVRYLLTFYDASKEAEFENMKLDFVSMAAHELRTPLTAIKGYLSYLDEELNGKLNEEQLTYLKRVLISSDQLSSLIENLLNVTKIERGMFKLDLAFFPLESLIEESLVNLYEVAVQKKIKVEFIHPDKSFPDVLGDKFRISQVFTNLVSNAINYTQVGGHVEIWMERTGEGVIVHVRDNGQGIPAASLPHLFTKFYRVGGALEQGSKGTGLGLFISRSIIERHNGKIWVESIEGKGSTFSFLLPVQAQ